MTNFSEQGQGCSWRIWRAGRWYTAYPALFFVYTVAFILLAYGEHVVAGLQADSDFYFYVKHALGAAPVYLSVVSVILLLPERIGVWYAVFWLIMHTLYTLLVAFLFIHHNLKLDVGICYMLKDTTPSEISAYLTYLLTPSFVLTVLFVGALLVLLALFCFKLKGGGHRFRYWAFRAYNVPIMLLLLKLAVIDKTPEVFFHEAYFLGGKAAIVYSAYRRLQRSFYHALWDPTLPTGLTVAGERRVDLGVIVIGESATRCHHACYGYPRMTTPNLSSLPADEVVYFTDVLSADHLTPIALAYAFTNRTLSDPQTIDYCILDVYKTMGYRVITLSNHLPNRQAFYGHATSIFRRSDKVVFGQGERDHVLLPMFRETLQNEKGPMVVFLHLRGSHGPYYPRYPESFAKFDGLVDETNASMTKQSQARINAYDNSILFTDNIIGQVLTMIKESSKTAFLVYFSDHGESVNHSEDDTRGFRDPMSDMSFEIPFVVWFSRSYREAFPTVAAGAAAAADWPLQVDRLTGAFLMLANIYHDDMAPADNIFSRDYVPRPRYINQGQTLYSRDQASGMLTREMH